jgi:hypothetical protein
MGTNLAKAPRREPEEPIWLLDSMTTVMSWITKRPAERRRSLDTERTRVYSGGKIASGTNLPEKELRRRGWGEVAYMSYGEWLVWLENALNDVHAGTDHGRKGGDAGNRNAQP